MKGVWDCLNLLRDGCPKKKTRGQVKEACETAMTTALSLRWKRLHTTVAWLLWWKQHITTNTPFSIEKHHALGTLLIRRLVKAEGNIKAELFHLIVKYNLEKNCDLMFTTYPKSAWENWIVLQVRKEKIVMFWCASLSEAYSQTQRYWPGLVEHLCLITLQYIFLVNQIITKKNWTPSHWTTRIQSSKSTSSERFILLVMVEKIRRFCLRSGRGNSIFLSKRPGRSRAGSKVSARLVAMITWGVCQLMDFKYSIKQNDTVICYNF